MNTGRKLAAAAAAIIIIVIAALAVSHFGGGGGGSPLAPAGAGGIARTIPAFDSKADHFALCITDTSSLRSLADSAKEFIGSLRDKSNADKFILVLRTLSENSNADLPDPVEIVDVLLEAESSVGGAAKFLSAADELAVLVTSSDAMLSFMTDDERFAGLLDSVRSSGAEVIKWETPLAKDGEAWLIRGMLRGVPLLEDPDMYVLKLTSGSRSAAAVSLSQETVERAADAWSGKAAAAIDRKLSSPNFINFRASNFDDSAHGAAAEMAWQTSGNVTTIESVVDSAFRGGTIRTSGLEDRPVPVYGEGDPLMLVTLDVPYLFSLALPEEDDPIEAGIRALEGQIGMSIPGTIRSDIMKILAGCRASAGAFYDKAASNISAAYLLAEMKDSSALSKYLAPLFMFMDTERVEGWEPFAVLDTVSGDMKAVLGKKGDTLMIGIGRPEAYASRPKLPAQIADSSSKGAIVSMYLDLKPFKDNRTPLDEIDDEDARMMLEMLRSLPIESIYTTQSDSENSRTIVTWER